MRASNGLGLILRRPQAAGSKVGGNEESRIAGCVAYLIAFAVSAITGCHMRCCSRMKAVSSSGVIKRM